MSLAISRPTDSVTWLKLLALPFLLFTPSQTLSTRQVMDLVAVDDWQSFFLGQPRHINPPSLAPSITNNATLQFRCAKPVEYGNLGKAFQLISSPSSVSTLTSVETIRLLRTQHPIRHQESFTHEEIAAVTELPPAHPNLPDFTSNVVLSYLRHAPNSRI